MVCHGDGDGLGVLHLQLCLLWLAVFLAVAVEGSKVALGEHGEVELEGEGRSCGVVACYVPGVAMAACQHAVLAWVAVDEDGFVPCGGHVAQEVHADGRCWRAFLGGQHVFGCFGGQVLWRDGEVLDGVLEEDAGG